MKFKEAYELMKRGKKVKLPSWGGYWYYDEKEQTILMKCRKADSDTEKDVLDIRETQRVGYTIENILSEDWVIADETNTQVLGGTAAMSFGDAIKYLKRGLRVARKGWNGKGMFLFLGAGKDIQNCTGIEEECVDVICMKTAQNTVVFGWLASQTDMLAEDWVII